MTEDKTRSTGVTPGRKRVQEAVGPVALGGQEVPYLYGDNDIGLAELWAILWQRKWLMIASATLFAVLSVAYALKATEWFRAYTLLAYAEQDVSGGLAGQFGGLAGLAGIDVPSGNNGEPLAVLSSREFAREFITDLNLLPVFFADKYDATEKAWIDPDVANHPDIRDGVKFFHDQILRVGNTDDGLVTLGIEWTDPQLAANWSTVLVERLNARMRQRALSEAVANVEYLQAELAGTKLVTIQQSVGRLMESELQKLMMARGRQEFAFRVIDSAVPPKERSRPRRALIAVFGTMLGGVLGFFAALFFGLRQRYRAAQAEST